MAVGGVLVRQTDGSVTQADPDTTGYVLTDNGPGNLPTFQPAGSGSGTVTNTGTLTSGKTIIGNGGVDVTVSSLTATVVKSASGTLSAATAGTDYTDAAFKTISVSGQSDVVADTPADTLTLAAGSNITITTNAATDTITIAASGGGGGTVTHTGALTASQLVVGNGADDIKVVPATNGQIPIGKTSDGTVTLGTITAGTGISVTNGAASITIAATGAIAGMVQLAQIVTSGSAARADFTGIPSGYTTLKLFGLSQDTATGTARSTVRVRLNNDSTSGNYTVTQRQFAQNGAGNNTALAASTNGVQVGLQPNAGNSGQAGQFEMTLQNYAGTTWHKIIQSFAGTNDDTVNGTIQQSVARWKSTAAVTQITVTTDGTAFLDGSTFTLYGLK